MWWTGWLGKEALRAGRSSLPQRVCVSPREEKHVSYSCDCSFLSHLLHFTPLHWLCYCRSISDFTKCRFICSISFLTSPSQSILMKNWFPLSLLTQSQTSVIFPSSVHGHFLHPGGHTENFAVNFNSFPSHSFGDESHWLFFQNISISPGWCGSVDWALAWEPKGCWFNSQSGHMSGLRARSPAGGMREVTTIDFFSPSLSPSHPLCLKISK